ncbi:MAG: hypothetical protein BRD46_00460, partial [Bacteroidetes bacterium QS_8_68_15]
AVRYDGTDATTDALDEHAAYVRNETLALRFERATDADLEEPTENGAQAAAQSAVGSFDLGDGEHLTLRVRRVSEEERAAAQQR